MLLLDFDWLIPLQLHQWTKLQFELLEQSLTAEQEISVLNWNGQSKKWKQDDRFFSIECLFNSSPEKFQSMVSTRSKGLHEQNEKCDCLGCISVVPHNFAMAWFSGIAEFEPKICMRQILRFKFLPWALTVTALSQPMLYFLLGIDLWICPHVCRAWQSPGLPV